MPWPIGFNPDPGISLALCLIAKTTLNWCFSQPGCLFDYFSHPPKQKKFKKEKKLAITEAVAQAVDSVNEYNSVEIPRVRTKIIYREVEKSKKQEAPKEGNVFTDKRDGHQYKYIEVEGMRRMA